MTQQELSEAIAIAYHADCLKPELIAVKDLARKGRKYGFPIICEIADKPENEQKIWAAKLLLSITNSWPEIDSLSCNDFYLIPDSQLHDDAVKFAANALAATQRMTEQ